MKTLKEMYGIGSRVTRVVVVQTGAKKGYGLFRVRIVRCEPNQQGMLSERGVEKLWESPEVYRPFAGGQGRKWRECAIALLPDFLRCA